MIDTRARLHELVDQLAPEELASAARYLEGLRASHDPALRAALAAPDDDEPLTPAEAAAIDEGLADLAAGRSAPLDQVRRRLFGD